MKNRIWADETDAALADAAARYLSTRYRFEDRQRLPRDEHRYNASVWKAMADMGWFSVTTPEAHSGLGIRVASACLLAEAAGRGLVTEPFASSGLLAPYLIAQFGTPEQRTQWLLALHSGSVRVAYMALMDKHNPEELRLNGRCEVVMDADIADQYIVSIGTEEAASVYFVDASALGVTRSCYPLLDARGAATVVFSDVNAVRLGSANTCDLRPALRLAALATAADSMGAMFAAFDLTLAYIKTRRQFGVPIGTNQALQHRAVDMFIRLVESRAVLDQAIESLEADSIDAARDVHAAKSFICESARLLAHEAVQLHGGIGITEEYAVSHYLRRVRVNEQLYGSAEKHLLDFAALRPALELSVH